MIHKPTNELKLVEYNTIASSMGCLCQRLSEIHAYIMRKYSDKLHFNYEQNEETAPDFIKEMADIFKRTLDRYAQNGH